LIAQAIALKVIQGGDTAIDATYLWAYSSKFGKKICQCNRERHHPRVTLTPMPTKDIRAGTTPQAKPLLMEIKKRHPQINIDSASMDPAHDSYENYRFAIEDIGAVPIIT